MNKYQVAKSKKARHGKYKAHVSKRKKDVVKEFVDLIKKYDVIAAVDMENLPARQLQAMKETMRSTVVIKLTKRKLIEIAIADSKKEGLDKLKPFLKGMPALLFSNENPFKLYATAKKSKSKAPIKGGQKAPHDIVVKAGTTSFAPGPIIGELGAFKIKTGIDGGKVAIKADAVVAYEGELVSGKLASILQRLGIQPMEIGLNIVAVFEKGEILTKAVLDIDEEQYARNFQTAFRDSLAVAMATGHITKETITLLLQKAHREAFALAVERAIPEKDALGAILAKAEAQARSLA
jgi:large subunit ribosomal protein L10